MIERQEEKINKPYDRWFECWNWCAVSKKRHSKLLFGTVLIIIGIIWFGKKAGWFYFSLWPYIAPVIVTIIGIWIVSGYLMKRRR
jgi:hypothetical protein